MCISFPLKTQIPRSLEGQVPLVPLNQKAIFRTGHVQFHPVAAFHLECHIVTGRCVVMMMVVCTTMTMMGNIGPFGDHGRRYGQTGRIVVLIPLSNPAYNRHRKNADDEHENYDEQNSENIEHAHPLIKTHAIPKTHFLSSCAFAKGASLHREAP